MLIELNDSQILSRYMSLDRFVDFCSKGLFLPPASYYLHNDPWEGTPFICWNTLNDNKNIEAWNHSVKQQIDLGNSHYSEKDVENLINLPSLENVKKAMSWIYVSCWHIGSEESMAMWKNYSHLNMGVCVQVKLDSLKKTFEQAAKENRR